MARRTTLSILVSLAALVCALAPQDAAAQGMTVTPANPSIPIGQTQQFATPDVSNAAAVTAGDYHVCVLLQNGEARCTGHGGEAQLGDGTRLNSSTPLPVLNLTQAAVVTTGGFHSCAVLLDHTVQCWGNNEFGQIGDGSTTLAMQPVPVSGISTAVAVAAGYHHTCALLQDGTVQCWGDNTYGQLGNGMPIPPNTPRGSASTAHSSIPVAVVGITNAVAVAASDGYHSCAVLQDGTVRCWGDNVSGQLGDGTRNNSSTPVTVAVINTAVDVSIGDFHSCALLQGGAVSCWGLNWTGQLGDGTGNDSNTPVLVSGINTAVSVTAGVIHSCAVLQDGTARCWGSNANGQLGNGTTANASAPALVSGISSALSITAGNNDSCAVLSGGLVRCWGMNTYGELGNGTTADGQTPSVVVDINPSWTTSNSAVATIDEIGRATGLAQGAATITASFDFMVIDRFHPKDHRSGSTTLTVGERPTLTVVRSGLGTGTVASSPGGITCGSTCSASFDMNAAVTLTASPATGSVFQSWSGCDSVNGASCTVTMSASRTVTATFQLQRFTLTVSKSGIGSGTVSSSPGGISCGGTCAADYDYGTMITLTASPAAGSVFDSWSGCNSVNGATCSVTMSASRTVTATFRPQRFTLTVSKDGVGTGTVSSSPGGIACGGSCSADYDNGTTVTLTATPTLGVFLQWGGACSGVLTSTCTVTMTAAKSVTATFVSLF